MGVIIHLVHLPLHQQTAIYIRYRQVPKIAFSPSSFAIRRTISKTHELIAPFLCQSVLFITRQVSELLLSPQSQELLSIATE